MNMSSNCLKMNGRIFAKCWITVIFCCWYLLSPAQPRSVFNGLAPADTNADFSFLVSGHFHGASTNVSSFPASTILAGLDTINGSGASFLISLGDLFLDVDSSYIQHYRKSFFSKLKLPLYNVVGNHDLANGNMYDKLFGRSYFSFQRGKVSFILLNTEMDDGSITAEQFVFFKKALDDAQMAHCKSIVVCSHRPVWAEQDPRYQGLFEGNTRSAIGKNNFQTEIAPLLSALPKSLTIYWISGSMAGGPSSFFYDQHPDSHIRFLQTAIRDTPRDAILKVNVNSGLLHFSGVSLTGQQLNPIESYSLDYWKTTKSPESQFNYRLVPMYLKQILMHAYFWVGALFGGLLMFILFKLRKRFSSKK